MSRYSPPPPLGNNADINDSPSKNAVNVCDNHDSGRVLTTLLNEDPKVTDAV